MRGIYLLSLLSVAGCRADSPTGGAVPGAPVAMSKVQRLMVESARDQLTWGTGYSGSYYKIAYPNGDPPRTTGACTDVIVRAFRHAGFDLQKLIHEDMKANWSAYPRYAGLPATDTNIDHRRVPNQRVFFRRKGFSLTTATSDPKKWQPGDVVTWKLASGRDHTGMLTDRLDDDGLPYVIHNIGGGPAEEDVLRTWTWTITGHFRYPKRP